MSQQLPLRTYKLRDGRRNALVGAVVVGAPVSLFPVLTGEFIPGWVKLLVTVLVLVFFGWLVVAAQRCATLVDRGGLTVKGFGRTRRLRWAEVQDIRVEPNPSAGMQKGAPTLLCYAYGDGGRRVQLMYVDDAHVSVDREAEHLRTLWAEHRGPTWAASPDDARTIARGAARRTALLSGFGWAMLSYVPFLALMVFVMVGDSVPAGVEDALNPVVICAGGPALVFVLAFSLSYRRAVRSPE
ncbi:PH domain-containing protein [Streptomyces sp. NPDC050504]|uniref:PH domain-containing protein n=1 Tax=Streptomyces sp. NPDC050504 TaxID=3365618 RepID=UPI0037980B34